MNYKNILIKPLCIIVLILFLLCPFVVGASTETRVLTTAKNPTGVRHYGTNELVEIIKEYDNAYAEMRGVWVATVYNIAISKQNGLNEKAITDYKNEFLTILDRMEEFGMNTIFFQVRPSNDAFYESELNPWSQFLVGSGVHPGWDPLEWMIDETHKRGFSFMCWMNAFRVTTETYVTNGSALSLPVSELVQMKHDALANLAEGNFAKEHPEYVIAGSYDEKLILNPSEPAVQKFIVDTIMEIVENYDVDGLHFDDYFYLNGTTSSDLENTNFVGKGAYTQSGIDIMNDWPNYYAYLDDPQNYGKDVFGENGIYGMEPGLNLGDFRRENINIMMRNIRKAIDAYNERTGKCVEFGSKPAAVWRSNSEYCTAGSTRCSENGSNTAEYAYSTYSDLYADSLKWVEEGLVDWVAPQVYYAFEDLYAPYADVVDWWAEQVTRVNAIRQEEGKKDIRLYIAHGIYKYRDNPDQFYRSVEITDQIRYNKHYDVIKGSAVYSYEILYKILGNDVTSSYPNAETIRKAGMSVFKNLWTNNKVFPLEVGEDDSQHLEILEYSLKETLEQNLILSFDAIDGARAYGYYKVPKDEVFDKYKIEYRMDILYAGYEENKRLSMNLGTCDENYNYYLVPVSKNGYVSDKATIINLDNKQPNLAPNSTDIKIIDYQENIKAGSNIIGEFELPIDPNHDLVSYVFKMVENGIERNIQPVVTINDNIVRFVWKSYLYETANCKFRIIFSDGELETIVDSQTFNLVEKFAPTKGEILLNKAIYQGYESIQISYHGINDIEGYPLTYSANLKVDDKVYDITDCFNQAINQEFEIEALNITSSNCYIEIIASNGYQSTTTISNKFAIIENTIPVGGSIQLENSHLVIGENLKGSIVLPTDNEELNYDLYLVINNQKEKITLNDDSLNFDIKLPANEIKNGYLELIVKDSYYEVVIKSNSFTVQSSQNEEPNDKNCKSCKNKDNLQLLFVFSYLGSGLFLYRKMKKH